MPDWDEQGLLDGLDGEQRAARARLLDELCSEGASVDALRAAVREQRLVLYAVERVMGPEPSLSQREVAERSGIPLALLRRTRQALGLPVIEPDLVAFNEEDVRGAQLAGQLVASGLPEEEVIATMRVLGSGMARYSESILSSIAKVLAQPGDTEHELATRIRDWTRAALPNLGPGLEYTARAHLRDQVRQGTVTLQDLQAGRRRSTSEVAVAFADLVGFTTLGEQVELEELGDVAGRLVEVVTDTLPSPVRFVKAIGDAVMLVSPEVEPLAVLCLDLVDHAERDDTLPTLRCGLAYGPALARLGDYYGATVNVAARLTARARPASVLVTEPVHDVLADHGDFALHRAGAKQLKGVSAPVPTWRVRRAD